MAKLHAYSLFHLNLAFSSVEIDRRSEIVEQCYWPLLKLAEELSVPIAVEASGYTLECIDKINPGWINRLSELVGDGIVEFIGSGYAQMIGPLIPAEVVAKNLEIGNEIYQRLLHQRPTIALVNEQAYSSGLLPHYKANGYTALFMDWDACAAHHDNWPREWRYGSHKLNADGVELNLLWTNTIAFQKMQRFAHDEIDLDEYLSYVGSHVSNHDRLLPLYGNDVEVFDFRPGRFTTEAMASSESEWTRIRSAYAALKDDPNIILCHPTEALKVNAPSSTDPLVLETAGNPIPVKKQHKYNITRWAVSGRGDLDANTRCWRIYQKMKESVANASDWKRLCYLWSSDFRTHITESRWESFLDQMEQLEEKLGVAAPKRHFTPNEIEVTPPSITHQKRSIVFSWSNMKIELSTRRGLAIIEWSCRKPGQTELEPICGTIPHGELDHIGYGFDWYSGNATFETPGATKIADLNPVVPFIANRSDGSVTVSATVTTPRGPIEKTLHLDPLNQSISFEIEFQWDKWSPGSLRLGNFTLIPGAFDEDLLSYSCHNGGQTPQTFELSGLDIDHGAPVTFMVSANSGLGLTEGWMDIGDNRKRMSINVDMETAALMGLVKHHRIGEDTFCRVCLSAMETDETRKPASSMNPKKFRFTASAVFPN